MDSYQAGNTCNNKWSKLMKLQMIGKVRLIRLILKQEIIANPQLNLETPGEMITGRLLSD